MPGAAMSRKVKPRDLSDHELAGEIAKLEEYLANAEEFIEIGKDAEGIYESSAETYRTSLETLLAEKERRDAAEHVPAKRKREAAPDAGTLYGLHNPGAVWFLQPWFGIGVLALSALAIYLHFGRK